MRTDWDGPCRPFGASPSGADLVTRTDYDSAGRESRSWLPVPVPNNGGKYVAPATLAARAESFYADEAPYGRTLYEASPLGRTASVFGPGKAWHESGRAVRNRYLTNSAADSLRCARYVADSDRDAVRLSRQGDYPEGELFDPSRAAAAPGPLFYCAVEFEPHGTRYSYRSEDRTLEAGELVVVPAGPDAHELLGRIVAVQACTAEDAPYPPAQTKPVLRRATPQDILELGELV